MPSTRAALACGGLVFAFAFGCSAAKTEQNGTPLDASLGDSGGLALDGASDDANLQIDGASGDADAREGGPSCVADSGNQAGCGCPSVGATQPCFSGDPSERHVGTCKDGTQTCTQEGEFSNWSACTGDVLPQKENCKDGLDNDCNGLVDCKDPSCATDAACNTGCTNGATRSCYTGAAGTLNVGTCRAGTQTCTGGKWPTTCTGQVLPTAEDCSDPKDHNCNHLPGCLDVWACATAAACQTQCTSPLPSGCVCPEGSGDTATCPKGTFAQTGGTLVNPTVACCPCTAKDCSESTANCCGEAVCAGNAGCGTVTCRALPSSCNGKVNADCDDFPEDCDEPCCECYGNCSGP